MLAVQDAIRLRLLKAETAATPADRLAGSLDLDWLEDAERKAFLEPDSDGVFRVIRMTVVLGHLAMVMQEHQAMQ